MRSVLAEQRIDLGVVICVVVCVGNLFVDVNVGGGQAVAVLCGCDGIADQCLYVLKGHSQLASVRGKVCGGECRVVVVQTRVKHCDHNAGSVISEVGAVKDTRFINVYLVFNQLGLRNVVDFAHDCGGAISKHVAKAFKVACQQVDLKAAHERVVLAAQLVADLGVIQFCDQLGLLRTQISLDCGCLLGAGKLGKAHAGGRALICIEQCSLLGTHDDRDQVCILDVIGELMHHVAVKIVLHVCLDVAVKQSYEGSCRCVVARKQQRCQHGGKHRNNGDQ